MPTTGAAPVLTAIGEPSRAPQQQAQLAGDGVTNENLELSNATAGGTITFTITNNGTEDLELDGFHFDSYAFRPKAARSYELSVLSGDISNGVIYTSADDEITTVFGAWDNLAHDDISHSLVRPRRQYSRSRRNRRFLAGLLERGGRRFRRTRSLD